MYALRRIYGNDFLRYPPSIHPLDLVGQELADKGRNVVGLAQGHALLAQNVVGGGEVEEDVGKDVSVDVVGAGHGEGAESAHADVDGLCGVGECCLWEEA